MNQELKCLTKKVPQEKLIKELREYCDKKFEQLRMGVFGRGQYALADRFCHLTVWIFL